MKSKLITLFLALVASVGTLFAWDYERAQIDELYYNLDALNFTAEVTYKSFNSDFLWYNDNWNITFANIPYSVTYDNQTYSVTSIGEGAFSGCSGLTSVTIPNSVTSIGDWAFRNCSSLTSIDIPNGMTSIGEYTFSGCSGLTSIDIPNSVKSIGISAFSGCSSLTSIEVETGNTNYDSRDNCNAIIETNTNTLIAGCQNTIIPNSVTSIGRGAFNACSGLTSIDIPNSVTSIGESAFNDCSGLTSITIPNGVTSIERETFIFCGSLTSVTIPNSLTGIGTNAFRGCSMLASITIPESVTSIGDYAFSYCYNLTSINIPYNVTNIPWGMFEGCSNLTSVTIPNSVTSIERSAFYQCGSLTSVTIPNSVTSIGESAFLYCSSLTSIDIPNSVTSIGQNAFYHCSSLTSIDIPNSVTSIGFQAFRDCSSLSDILVKWTTSEALASVSLGSGVFNNVPTSAKLHVPSTALYDYVTTAPWSNFHIVAECSDEDDITSEFASMVDMGEDNPAIDFELGRTLYKDGYYNTICLPFGIEDFEGTPLEGATVKEFVNAEVVDGCLELNVTDATAIVAGKPYLISFESGEDITDAVFEEVTIATSTAQTIDGGAVDFVGILAPTDLELNNTNMLFLGANNELYWPNTNDPLRGYRAYFAVNSGSSAPVRYGMPARIVEQQNTATAIADNAAASMPEKKLVNGELVISRGSSSYNVLGMNIR